MRAVHATQALQLPDSRARHAARRCQALVQFEQIVEIGPADADAWRTVGIAYKAVFNYTAAAAAFERVLAFEPANAGAEPTS